MNLEQQIYFSCAAYSSIHPNRAAVLNHLFVVLGNGYEWLNGQLVECCGDTTTKSGKRLSMQAAINQVFRKRRKNNEYRKEWELKRKREQKEALKHKKDCPAVMICNCGFKRGVFKVKKGTKGCTNWCRSNFPEDQKCNCGAQARIDEQKKQNASINELIDKCLAEIKSRPPQSAEEKAAEKARHVAELKKIKAEIRNSRKHDYRVPADIKKRVKDTEYNHWYPVSMNYPSNLANFPDDIKDEWLDAIIETATLIADSYARFERGEIPPFSTYPKDNDPTGEFAKQSTRNTYVVANYALHRANEMKLTRKKA